jgi:Transposase DDE domain/Insertion element 4 transposase N-terminal
VSIGKAAHEPLRTFRRELASTSGKFSLEALCADDVAARVEEALAFPGAPKARACALSRRFVMWLVLCLPLYRSESIAAILQRLISGLRGRIPNLPLDVVGDDAVAHARRRLGPEPLRRLFEGLGKSADPGPRFRALRVLAIDGVHLMMPDTPDNLATFGKPNSARGSAAFPQLLVTGLIAARSRQLVDATIARATASERPEAVTLLRSVMPNDLLLLDRGFYGAPFFKLVEDRRAHFLSRANKAIHLKPLRGQSRAKRKGDYLAEISASVPLAPGEVPAPHRTKPRTKTKKVTVRVRVIEYRVRGFERVRLVTSLLDPRITAREIIALYHERWEFELANDETKVHLSAAPAGTSPTTLRSKTAANVTQEVYALLAMHCLIRRTMGKAAKLAECSPLQLSFLGSVRVLQQAALVMSLAPARRLPELYEALLRDISRSSIDRPRRPRRYPRVVKRKMSNFPLKRSHHRALPAFIPPAPEPQKVRCPMLFQGHWI